MNFLDWFLEPFFKILAPFYPYLSLILNPAWQIIKNWWWLPLPFFFWPYFKYFWLWWRQEKWAFPIKFVLLEIRLPRELPRPIKAMEQVFIGLHSCYDPPANWREKWLEGQSQLRFSFEIVSREGEIHFYIRTPEIYRKIVESNIYAQYPEVEIFEVEDYTKKVPQDIPNKEWDLWGSDLLSTKEDPYPIKTYTKFETEGFVQEERKVDPLSGFLEGLASLGEGEQIWFQINLAPIKEEKPWVKQGLEIRDKILKRALPRKPKPIFEGIFEEIVAIFRDGLEFLISGRTPSPSSQGEEKEVFPSELRLSPGEREIVSAIEEKIAKFGFDCNIRFIYLGRREVFFKPRTKIGYSFFREVSSENLAGLRPEKRTITKVKTVFFWFLDERRLYLRQRKMFKNYQARATPFSPQPGGTFVLNTEELATLYHFPGKIVAPTVGLSRIEAKKVQPPFQLPTE